MFLIHIAATVPAVGIGPILDPIYNGLPGGSLYGFLLSLPGAQAVDKILFALPGISKLFGILGGTGIPG